MPSALIQGDSAETVTLNGGEFLLVTASGVLRNNPTTVVAGGTGVDIDVQGLIFSLVNAIQVEGRNISKPIPWDAQIVNSGSIIGQFTGIAGFDFGTISLTNEGIVRGGSDGMNLASVFAEGGDVYLVNNGTITGSDGISMTGLFVPQFVNTGTISGTAGFGVYVESLRGDATFVNSGVIAGTEASFRVLGAGSAAATLINTGTLAGTVRLGDAPDLFDGRGGITTAAVQMGLGADTVYAGSGTGRFEGQEGSDLLVGSASGNVMLGDADDDTLLGGAGDDNLQGGNGLDEIDGGEGNDIVRGGAGADVMEGGLGRDLLDYAQSIGVNVNLATGEGFFGDAAGDVFSGFENIAGGSGRDTLTGDGFANALYGRSFDDILAGAGGNDHLLGQDGNDTLDGGLGADVLRGGFGADRFVFASPLHSTNVPGGRDRILDFVRAEGDRIDLSLIDANVTAVGNEAFTFVAGAFTAASQVRAIASGGTFLVQGNTDANLATIEFSIIVVAANPLGAIDFVL